MEQLQVGRATLTWLSGGVSFPDGGGIFGVVPQPVWTNMYPADKYNRIEMRTDPILIQIDGKNYLVDSGGGNDKFTDKQIRNFGIKEQSLLQESLNKLGLTNDDLDAILMTHLHYDHANGLTNKIDDNSFVSAFPNVPIYTSEVEWNEMRNPNIRSKNTYWKMNWVPIANQVHTFKEEIQINDYLKMFHTGGHSDGHSIIVFEDGSDCFIHMADLLPTFAHQNPLWVMAFDDYPMTSIYEKEKWMAYGYEREAWYTSYHDAYYRAVKYDKNGKIIDKLKRNRYDYT